ncbi:nuclear pore glycoprotein p62 isoform X2 [Aethina tumida]|uniref:nuclear pore glycoprotein p62 isoform X2 n=1 Tax=Aethina tumida TaxID=116153 RepID=UPI002148AAC6|nr:nuclear pore glycoprotein p62 isoform X2 [Aethina tumida]
MSEPPKTVTGFTMPAAAGTPATTGFQIGTPTSTQNKPATSLFGANTTAFGAPGKTTPNNTFGTSTPSTYTLGTPVSTPSSSISMRLPKTTTASSTFTPILGTSGTTTATSTTTAAPKLTLGGVPSTASTASVSGSSSSSATTVVSNTAALQTAAAPAAMTFGQLEDSINKWTVDLEEQGKMFINQAKHMNAWDTLLISNGDNILTLNGSISRVKQQQSHLDQELDFVLAQQKELEELILPLEKELNDLPVTDIDRNQMYQLSENIDSQLKQMSDDLKEIIEHINESHKGEEISNPIVQICKILNAHMNSLQWIDTNTAQISNQLEQINRLQEINRRQFAMNHNFKNF